MAQNRMTRQALLDQLQGADTDVVRRVLEHAMQRLIEAEAATQIGTGPARASVDANHVPAHGGTRRQTHRRCENSTEFTPLPGT